uniref:Cardiotrophin-like cytokine factor 1 n=1 Tax=Esox lucius TaxID=8010 RepID=A0A3P9API1_ESOLU
MLLTLLLVVAVATGQGPDPSLSLANERTSIERTYELTIYLEHQLREIKRTYLSYLGPPFSDPDFSPPRPNSTALTLPSAATRLELWRGLENRARLAQNQRAYFVLLGAVRELARSTLCPYLQTSLLHFSTGLDGLLGSISGLMSTLGYAQSPAGVEAQYLPRDIGGARGAAGRRPVSMISHGPHEAETGAGPRSHEDQRGAPIARGGKEENPRREMTERKRDREKDRERGRDGRRAEAAGVAVRSVGFRQEERGERGRKGRKRGVEDWEEVSDDREEEELEREEGRERWGRRRRLLSVSEEGEMPDQQSSHPQQNLLDDNNKLFSYTFHYHPQPPGGAGEGVTEEEQYFIRESSSILSSSASLHPPRRSSRSLFAPTLHPPLSLFYPFEAGEGHTLLSEPVPLSLRR